MFGADIFDLTLLPALAVAALAGLMSFLSPCVLPIVPPYLAYMGGVSMAEMSDRDARAARKPVLRAALFFVLGLSTVFLLMGAAASELGRYIIKNQVWFTTAAGLTVMLFGAHFIGIFRLTFMDRDVRFDVGDRGGSALGAYVLGLAFAFGWTPCIGPILGTILSLAASQGDVARGTALLLAYALGLGVPFVLVAWFFPRLTGVMTWMKRHMERIERLMGLMLWTVGLLMLTGQFTRFAFWLNETFPALQDFG